MKADENGKPMSVIEGSREALKREMFERLVHEEGDGWKELAERLEPRRDHLSIVTKSPND